MDGTARLLSMIGGSTRTAAQGSVGVQPNGGAQLPQLRQVIGQVVGRTFYGTLLKQMRESSVRGTFGHGGRGEEVFSAQLHDLLAERIGASQAKGLSDAMVKRLSRQQAAIDRERAALTEREVAAADWTQAATQRAGEA